MKTFYYYEPKPNERIWVSETEIKHLYGGDIRNHAHYDELKKVKARSLREAMTQDLD